jgi:hypothetical protein
VDWVARTLAIVATVLSGLTYYSTILKSASLHATSSGMLLSHKTLNKQTCPVVYLNSSIWNEGAHTGVVDDLVLQLITPDGHHRRYPVRGILVGRMMAPGPPPDSEVFRPLAITGKSAQAYTLDFPADPGDQILAGKYTVILNAKLTGSHGYYVFEKRQFTFPQSSSESFAAGSDYYVEFDDAWDLRKSLPLN